MKNLSLRIMAAGLLVIGGPAAFSACGIAAGPRVITTGSLSLSGPGNATLTYVAPGAAATLTDSTGLAVTVGGLTPSPYHVTVQSGTTTGHLQNGAVALAGPLSITATGLGTLGAVAVTTNASTLASNIIGAPGTYTYPLTYSQPTTAADAPGTYTAILTFLVATGT